jgi:hypothetical protein
MQVLYDPVGSEQLHHIYQDGRVTMQFVGKAARTEVNFLFDSGASTDYVFRAFARMHVSECAVNSAALSYYAVLLCTALMQHIASHAR